MRKGRLFVISAPSGSGKTTICKKVLKKVKGLVPSVSFTTRAPRKGEKDKKDYYYLSEADFKKEIKNRNLLEWEKNFGYLYGTSKRFVLDKMKSGADVLLSIDVKGAMRVRKKIPRTVLIFVKPPSMKELSRRLKGRNSDTDAEIAARLGLAKDELNYAPKYDYEVVNKKLEKAVRKIAVIIEKERGM